MIRKAQVSDVPEIQRLVNYFAEKDQMLPRSLNTIYESLRDFFVVENGGKVVGCCALHITWNDLAEIKSLAVDESHQGSGLGRLLVEACLSEARQLGIPRVFCLTYVPEFFERLGFTRTDKSRLPHKIWSECINCHKFPNCGEEAMILDL
jgi:amino-acid N-acetyltransferase